MAEFMSNLYSGRTPLHYTGFLRAPRQPTVLCRNRVTRKRLAVYNNANSTLSVQYYFIIIIVTAVRRYYYRPRVCVLLFIIRSYVRFPPPTPLI
jgi:hypothetical protein